jgi:hypothetical protein
MKFKTKNLFAFLFVIALFLVVTFPAPASAACDPNNTNPTDPSSCNYLGAGTGSGDGVTFTNSNTSITCPTGNITGLICNLQQLLNSIVPLLIALGVVYFVWGVVQYVIGDGEEAKKKGRDRIIFGIIGLAIIIGLWGLVNIVVKTFNLAGQAPNASIANLVTVQTTTSAGCPATLATGATLQVVFKYFTCIIKDSVIPFIFALAMVSFIWGVVNFFILNADEEAKRAQGKQFMLWGIIALAVMISVWGLVNILGATFGVKSVLPGVAP